MTAPRLGAQRRAGEQSLAGNGIITVSGFDPDERIGRARSYRRRNDPLSTGRIEMTETEIAEWRRGERARLLAARLAVSTSERDAWTARIAAALPPLLTRLGGRVLGFYWPVRGEVDL